MTTRELYSVVLQLPRQERARLAQLLLGSLDHPPDDQIEQDWLRVAAHRAVEIDHGDVQLVTAEALDAQVEALLK